MEQKNEETLGTGASPVTTALSGMLTSEGAPWRPFEDQGLLLERSRTAQLAKALYAAGEQTLLTHLEAVCLWPERARNQSWRVGDYSCYVLSFEPAPGFQVYVQFRSEPDDGSVIFEVSSGALDPRAARYVDESKRERLRDHGFEIEGQARNFRKLVSVRDSRDLRGLAREAIAILTHVLGWNGTQALEYELSLQSGSQVRLVVEALAPETLAKMMREWGFPAQLTRSEGTGTL